MGTQTPHHSWVEPWQPVWDLSLGQKVPRVWLYGSSMVLSGGRYLRLACVCNGHSQTQRNLLRGESQLFVYNLEMPPRYLYKREKGRGKLKKFRLSWKQENLYNL